MASIRRRGNKWQCRITRAGAKPLARTFNDKQGAVKWGRAVERDLDRGTYLADQVELERTTLLAVLRRYPVTRKMSRASFDNPEAIQALDGYHFGNE